MKKEPRSSDTPAIGFVGDDGRVRDAHPDGEPLDLATEAAPGSVGLIHNVRDGRSEFVPTAAAGSASAAVHELAARRGLSLFHGPEAMMETAGIVEDRGLSDPALEDLTHLPFVTIDDPDSRDLDQALYIERWSQGWGDLAFKVWYAIADPAWSVRPGTALFAEALARGATYYLPGLMIPMLPRVLSGGVISLLPDAERRAMVFEVNVNEDGTIAGSGVRRARVKSRLKTSYDAVQAFLDGEALHGTDDRRIAQSLQFLQEVGDLLICRADINVVHFRRREISVSLAGAEGMRFVAIADTRNEVERFNEQISLLCNTEGARMLREGDAEDDDVQPIYRVHDPPTPERLAELAGQIEALVRLHGMDGEEWYWRRGRQSLASFLQALPETGRAGRLAQAVNRQALLTSGRAGFAASPSAHFGVGAEVYGRFTAPMREVVGIFLHKELWEKLHGKTRTPPPPWDDDERLREQVIEAASRARQTQRELDREVNRLVLDQLFSDDLARDLGDRPLHRGTVLGISRSKVHVGLDDPPIDVKVYVQHIARQLGERVGQGEDGLTLRRLDGGEVLRTVGDEAMIRVRGHDGEQDRWELELVGPM